MTNSLIIAMQYFCALIRHLWLEGTVPQRTANLGVFDFSVKNILKDNNCDDYQKTNVNSLNIPCFEWRRTVIAIYLPFVLRRTMRGQIIKKNMQGVSERTVHCARSKMRFENIK